MKPHIYERADHQQVEFANERADGCKRLDVGQVVLVAFFSKIVDAQGNLFSEFLRVRVTARHRHDHDRYRGELISQPDRRFFHPRDLRIGHVFEFTTRSVIVAFR